MKNKQKYQKICCVFGIFFVCLTGISGEAHSLKNSNPNMNDQITLEETVDNNMSKKLHAQSAALIDADSGRVLFEKQGNSFRANASTTKILTCILALESEKINEIVTVSKKAASMPDVQLNIEEGEQYYLKDLLYSMMLESHNDSAVAIAEHVAGSQEKFADLMNQKAKEIGCQHSYFVSSNGLDQCSQVLDKKGNIVTKYHGTTAIDLAQIMRYCIKLSPKAKEFLEITQTPVYEFSSLETEGFSPHHRKCRNHNAYLSINKNAISGKTGFTSKAGYCYVGAVKKDQKEFVVSLLGCGWPNEKGLKWEDCNTLFAYGFDSFDYVLVPKWLPKQYPVQIQDGKNSSYMLKDRFVLYPQVILPKQILCNKNEKCKVMCDYKDNIIAPIKGKIKVGTVSVYAGNYLVKQEEMWIEGNIEKRDALWYRLAVFFQLIGL